MLPLDTPTPTRHFAALLEEIRIRGRSGSTEGNGGFAPHRVRSAPADMRPVHSAGATVHNSSLEPPPPHVGFHAVDQHAVDQHVVDQLFKSAATAPAAPAANPFAAGFGAPAATANPFGDAFGDAFGGAAASTGPSSSSGALANGALASPLFFNRFTTPGMGTVEHAGLLSRAEMRLLYEWLDLGAQYFNNTFHPNAN